MLNINPSKEEVRINLKQLKQLIERTTAIHTLIRSRIELFHALSIPLLDNPFIKLHARCIELEYMLRLQMEYHLNHLEAATLTETPGELDDILYIPLNTNLDNLILQYRDLEQAIQCAKIQEKILRKVAVG